MVLFFPRTRPKSMESDVAARLTAAVSLEERRITGGCKVVAKRMELGKGSRLMIWAALETRRRRSV